MSTCLYVVHTILNNESNPKIFWSSIARLTKKSINQFYKPKLVRIKVKRLKKLEPAKMGKYS